MKLRKVKIIATICSLAMAIAMLGFATFAAFESPADIGGNLVVKGIEAGYKLKVSAGTDILLASTDVADLDQQTLADLDLTYDEEVTLVFEFTSTMDSSYATVAAIDITFDFALDNSTYDYVEIQNGTDEITFADAIQLHAGETLTIEVTVKHSKVDEDLIIPFGDNSSLYIPYTVNIFAEGTTTVI